MIYLLADTGAQALDALNSQLKDVLGYYSDWGWHVGVGMICCCFAASLVGIIIRSL
jgi:uncharacterized membrane protein